LVTGATDVPVTVEFGVVTLEVAELLMPLTKPDVVEVTAEVVLVTAPETVATVVLSVLGTTDTVPVMVGTAESSKETTWVVLEIGIEVSAPVVVVSKLFVVPDKALVVEVNNVLTVPTVDPRVDVTVVPTLFTIGNTSFFTKPVGDCNVA
jgi:hypothetical protein